MSLIIDGTEQANYANPHFAQATKNTMEATEIPIHLIGVIAHGRRAFAYTMYEDIGNKLCAKEIGSNQIIPTLIIQRNPTTKPMN